ncbi:FAD binding domain-containing protein [Caldisericum exile]|uniref:Oxidoreductase FAD binding subunit n=1 Tax=Caldisericum exile (strain DSM 21853 / NBRC 104410 / AZM16c01) TaxID=511051 RepID=A0A7U6GEA3_CALEA|nr:FAD binding domain-containing protein [Caldisericum exile]BAL80804.1 oxidoreductase FAD binding subunit [Caldisericum exile AZM16c01]
MLKLKNVAECFYPKTIDDAVSILKEKGDKAKVVGGGLHLTVFPNPQIEYLIFLDNLDLNYVRDEGKYISIGATTTITDAANSKTLNELFDGKLSQSLSLIASELLRNQITFGGSVAQREPYSDIATILLSLDADVVYFDGSTHTENLNDFYKSDFREKLKTGIITEVRIKKFDKLYKFGIERHVRNATDISLLNMAMLGKIEDNVIEEIIVSYGSRPMPAERFSALEDFLRGKKLDEVITQVYNFAKEHADVKGDVRKDEAYRRELTGIFAKRLLESFGR